MAVYYSETGTAAIRGRCVDIGFGGLRVLLDEDVAVGQRLWLEFSLAGSPSPLRILSKVKHGFDRRYGLQFLNITPEQGDFIRETCRDLPNV